MHRRSLTQEVITFLEEAMEGHGEKSIPSESLFAKRKLLPGYAALQQSGALVPKRGDRDITDLISEDRDEA